MSELSLLWDGPNPIGQTNLSQPEYRILRIMPRQEITNYNTRKLGKSGVWTLSPGVHFFLSAGDYSSLFVDFIIRRETGQYFLEYYIPSILLVTMSWVSFVIPPVKN